MSLKPPTINSESELSPAEPDSLKPPTAVLDVSVEESVEISAGEVSDDSLKPPTP